jgi:hypothetical protein
MKYTVDRIDDSGNIIIGYNVELHAGGPYQAFLEWIDFHLESPSSADVTTESGNKSTEKGEYRIHARVTELEGGKRIFTY